MSATSPTTPSPLFPRLRVTFIVAAVLVIAASTVAALALTHHRSRLRPVAAPTPRTSPPVTPAPAVDAGGCHGLREHVFVHPAQLRGTIAYQSNASRSWDILLASPDGSRTRPLVESRFSDEA